MAFLAGIETFDCTEESPLLLMGKKEDEDSTESTSYTAKVAGSSEISVSVSHLTASWSSELDTPVLKEISFYLDKVLNTSTLKTAHFNPQHILVLICRRPHCLLSWVL